jgi:hypothetical protein
MKYILSPEFHRNLWLRFSPFSLIAAPVFLGLIAFICLNSGGNNSWERADAPFGNLANVMLIIFFIVINVAGNYEAGTALHDELRTNTWDFQRMSSISAAKLAFGKLFGATAYHWYFAFLTLCFFAYGYQNYQVQPRTWDYNTGKAITEAVTADNSLFVVLIYMVLSGLIGHALAFVSGYYDMISVTARGGARGKAFKGVNAFILGLICSSYIFSTITMQSATHLQRGRYTSDSFVDWLGGHYPAATFIPLTLLFFFAWFLIGAYRLARTDLMHNQTPVAWLGFVCTSIFWVSGFMYRDGELAMRHETGFFGPLLMGFSLMAAVTYFTMLNESSDFRRYSRFWNYLKQGQTRRVLENMPKWLSTAPVAIALYVAFLSYGANIPVDNTGSVLPDFACLLLAVMLFMARDGFAVHAIQLGVRKRGAGFVILFYYAIAYVILPLAAFAAMGRDPDRLLRAIFRENAAEDLRGVAGFFFPIFTSNPGISVFPGLLQLGIAAGLLYWLFGKRQKAAETPKIG